jgi:acylglycerol lipase
MSGLRGHGDIFISYRREETAAQAGRLYDRLRSRFGENRVFRDIDSIAIGTDFEKAIKEAVSKCDILLALIGPKWASLTDSNAARRIKDPRDYVRLEIETALHRDIPVVPVLVDEATLPKADELPPSLRPLIRRQALVLSNTGFDSEVSRLVAAVADVVDPERTAELPGRSSPPPGIQRGRRQPELPDHEGTAPPTGLPAVGVADKIEGHLTGVDNTRLYWQGWLPTVRAMGVLLFCHGAYEHSGRYQNVVDALAPDGWAVYGLDLRGHGRSTGERVHVERFSDWVDDFDRFSCEVVPRHQDLPVFALGHCLGAQIALAYALDHQEVLRGLVLSAPFLATAAVPGFVRPAGRVISQLLPRKRWTLVRLDEIISKDTEVVKRYRNDPLVYKGNGTLVMMRIVEQQFNILMERSRYLRIPVLIQHGAEDALADPDGSRRLERAVGSPDRTFIPYDGLWHEIYNEPERQRPLDDLREWLANHR